MWTKGMDKNGLICQQDQPNSQLLYEKSTTTTKPYPTKWGRLHGSNDVTVFYQKSYLDPTH